MAPVKTDAAYDLISAVMATADAFLREGQRLFRPHGLSVAQYNVLNVVCEAEAGLSQRELSEDLVVDSSNVTGLVDRMEKAGWVKRTDNPTDRRAYRIVPTSAGRKLWEEVTPQYLAAVAKVTKGLSVQRMKECRETLVTLENAAAASVPHAK